MWDGTDCSLKMQPAGLTTVVLPDLGHGMGNEATDWQRAEAKFPTAGGVITPCGGGSELETSV